MKGFVLKLDDFKNEMSRKFMMEKPYAKVYIFNHGYFVYV